MAKNLPAKNSFGHHILMHHVELGYILILPDSPTETTNALLFSLFFHFNTFPPNKADTGEGSATGLTLRTPGPPEGASVLTSRTSSPPLTPKAARAGVGDDGSLKAPAHGGDMNI